MTDITWTEPQLRRAIGDESARRVHRAVVERWHITGTLTLETPAHFGTGEVGDYSDMPVLLDENGRPYLPGASLAGALRNYLREREAGDGKPFPKRTKGIDNPDKDVAFKNAQARERSLYATRLFGFYRGDDDDDGAQSPLVVYDAPGRAAGFELRDGVAIDGKTRTAAMPTDQSDGKTRRKRDGKKFDIELLAAGTTFDLCLELAVALPRPRAGDTRNGQEWHYAAPLAEHRDALLAALAAALGGLEAGEITFGARKRRGYGRCRVDGWQVRRFDMATRDGLLAWLALERDDLEKQIDAPDAPAPHPIAEALAHYDASPSPLADARQRVRLTAAFAVDSSLLIRAGFGDESADAPDMTHLHSRREGGYVPIIPGTSWAGVLRHRAERILNTLAGDDGGAGTPSLLENLFGPAKIETDQPARASRLTAHESDVSGGRSLAQTRVRIDRFTGGALETALFEQQPLYGADSATVGLTVEIRPPWSENGEGNVQPVPDHDIGLLLLLLKDLWTGDLRVGGESGVGRGVLRGLSAKLTTSDGVWQFAQMANGLQIDGDPDKLQHYVTALGNKAQGKEENKS